jgi:hypothetical protein
VKPANDRQTVRAAAASWFIAEVGGGPRSAAETASFGELSADQKVRLLLDPTNRCWREVMGHPRRMDVAGASCLAPLFWKLNLDRSWTG